MSLYKWQSLVYLKKNYIGYMNHNHDLNYIIFDCIYGLTRKKLVIIDNLSSITKAMKSLAWQVTI